MRAGIALGSNLGHRQENIRSARGEIYKLRNVGPPFLSSPMYETEPVGCEPGAQKFVNVVLEVECAGEPRDLLGALRRIEQSLGRAPNHKQNTSRTIDLDLLYFGDRVIDDFELQLPHPRMQQRRFVLQPLRDIRPDLVLPGQTKSVRQLLDKLADDSTMVRVGDEW
jgi:2-amino-4-hydroxy-6-hydroxymethyldihydropteridine diphosphokinase